ncbi:DUF6221 family protein [Streptomyces sp. G1]|uniref:DUF6221 family protein n=1 Tax=Streptomyces sp. G1 TaxID=361572 RepID=UPI00202FF2DD|nr:DUF6221 family protein [Streptomyces sp. G1]MCM1972297.1 DUF6221 family protein [Streptomyces sp. G1]
MITMDDFVQWLRAQLDEDERIARAATPGPWRYDPGKHHHIVGTPLFEEAVFAGPPGSDATCVAGTGETDDRQSMADAAHIARHDPARVLREVDAKRQLLTELEAAESAMDQASRDGDTIRYNSVRAEWVVLRRVVRRDAAVYAHRPGYRPEWRP